jgi:hypothetical protein
MFEETCNIALTEFKIEYGEKKYNQIYKNVLTSSSFKKNMPILIGQRGYPNSTQLIAIIQNIPFFTFSSKKNTAIGGTILLYKWNLTCNINNVICRDEDLIEVVNELFKKSSELLY